MKITLALAALVAGVLFFPVAAGAQDASPPLTQIGAFDPGTPGLNASAVGLDGIAYLGSWGSTGYCPGLGVRVIDVRNPSAPALLSTAAAYSRTTAEHVAAVRMATSSFTGSVLFTGIQRCSAGGGAEGGLAAWDVSDPTNPRELSFLGVGRSPRGVHEFTLGERDGRWYAYLAVPNSEVVDGRGDLRIVDVTDPSNQVEVASWGARRDAGLSVGSGRGCAPNCRGLYPQAFLHSVALSPDGRTAYLSYWDLGVVILDVSEPSAPRFLGRFAEPEAAEGNTHSVSIAHDGRLALVADETFEVPWGRMRLVDVRDPSNPVQIGSFDTYNSAVGRPGGPEEWYSIHNPLVDNRDPFGNRAYAAWYADGVRLIDVSDGSAPYELASWVPERSPMVWSVNFMDDYVVVGDVNTGLYLLTR